MIIFRYLAKEVLSNTFAVSFVLVLLIVSARFVGYLAEAAAGSMDGGVLLTLMAFRLPAYLELILPLGLFLGIMMAYGRMYLESEMTILSACGITRRRILTYSLVIASAVAVLVSVFSLMLGPKGVQATERLLIEARNRNELETIKPTRFHKLSGGGGVSYAESVSDDSSELRNVFFAHQAEKEEGGGFAVLMADTGLVEVQEDTGGKYFTVRNGKRYVGEPGQYDFTVVEFESFSQRLASPDYSQIEPKKPTDGMSTLELFNAESAEAKAALQWRLSVPVLVFIVTLLAVPLSKTQVRQGRYAKMVPAIIVYLLYLVSLNAARGAVEAGDAPSAILWFVHLLFLLVAAALNLWDWFSALIGKRRATSNYGAA